MNEKYISAATQYVVLRGSETVTFVAQAVARAFMREKPEIGLPMIGGGTARGFKAALDGTADIGMASGPMPEEMRRWAKRRALELVVQTIAFDGIAAIVNPANRVTGLSLQQLGDIYTGAVRDWSEVGGDKGPITVYSQDPLQGTQETWNRLVADEGSIITPKAVVVAPEAIAARIAADPGGIGYEAAVQVDRARTKVLPIDGVMPDTEHIRTGAYKIRRELRLVTPPQPRPEAAAFIAYCLDPNKGQKLLQAAGVVPVHTG